MNRDTLDRLILLVVIAAIVMVFVHRRQDREHSAHILDADLFEPLPSVQVSRTPPVLLVPGDKAAHRSSVSVSRDIFKPLVSSARAAAIPEPPKPEPPVTEEILEDYPELEPYRPPRPLRATISGILSDGTGGGRVIINENIYTRGDSIQEYRVDSIGPHYVNFIDEHGNITTISNAERP